MSRRSRKVSSLSILIVSLMMSQAVVSTAGGFGDGSGRSHLSLTGDDVLEVPSEDPRNDPFTLFTVPPFDTVLPDTQPAEGDISVEVRGWGAPGQDIQGTFSLHAKEDMENVSVRSSDLVNGSDIIPSSSVDLRVVKVWLQGGLDRHIESPVLVPELLVYDDLMNLTGGWNLTDASFPDGHLDKGYLENGKGELTIQPETVFDAVDGTVEFWTRTNWSGSDDSTYREFIWMSDGSGALFRMYSHINGRFYAVYDDGVHWEACSINDSMYIIEDQWTRITFTWNTTTDNLTLYIDGAPLSTNTDVIDPMPSGKMYIGGTREDRNADALLDDMRFYNYSASPGEVAAGVYRHDNLTVNMTFDSKQAIEDVGADLHRRVYDPPNMPTEMNTEIPVSTTKQFWYKIRVPEEAVPGIYRTNLTVRWAGDGEARIPFELEILPFRLRESPLRHMVYLSGRPNTTYLSYEMLDIYLDDMEDHGLNGLSFSGYYLDEMNRTLDLLADRGLENVVLSTNTDRIHDKVQAMEDRGFAPFIYGVDEPNHSPELEAHIRKSHEIHLAGGKVAVAITKAMADELDNPNSPVYDLDDPANPGTTFREQGITDEGLDWSNYHATYLEHDNIGADGPLLDYINDLRAGGEKLERTETYYWQPWVQKYKWDRDMAGFFLWGSKLGGSWPWHYMDIPDYDGTVDPFDDMDNIGDGPLVYRDLTIVYPREGGVIPTLQWEAMAEGVVDVRYLATLENLTELVEDQDPDRASDIRNWTDDLLDRFMVPNQTEAMSGKVFDDTRRAVADRILKLQREFLAPVIDRVTVTPEEGVIPVEIRVNVSALSRLPWSGITYSIDMGGDGSMELEGARTGLLDYLVLASGDGTGRVVVEDIGGGVTEANFTYSVSPTDSLFRNVNMTMDTEGNVLAFEDLPNETLKEGLGLAGEIDGYQVRVDRWDPDISEGEVLGLMASSGPSQVFALDVGGLVHDHYALIMDGRLVRNITPENGSLGIEMELEADGDRSLSLMATIPPPDLFLDDTDLFLDPSKPAHGSGVTVRATVHATNLTMNITVNATLSVDGMVRDAISAEMSNRSVDLLIELAWTAREGEHELDVSVSTDDVIEASDGNNQASVTVEVPLRPLDLFIPLGGVELLPESPQHDSPTDITVFVHGRNVNSTVLPEVHLEIDNISVGSDHLEITPDRTIVSTTFRWTAEEGDHTIVAMVQASNVTEGDLENNTMRINISVSGPPPIPDIWLVKGEPLLLHEDGGELGSAIAGKEFLLNLSVRAIHIPTTKGGVEARIQIREDDNVLSNFTSTVSNGGTRIVAPLTLEEEGVHDLTVEVTPLDMDVAEKDIDNNLMDLQVQVRRGDRDGTTQYGTILPWIVGAVIAVIAILTIISLILFRSGYLGGSGGSLGGKGGFGDEGGGQ